jgi:two-component system chemotaxis sensor kinase CheA
LSIEDDGRGINLDMLRQKAAKLWAPENGASMGMPDQELLQLIFREQFSTARGVTEWAGRGIGLAAVKEEVDRLGGEIIVTTVPGMGTKFLFHLPDEGFKGEVASG